MKNKRRAIQLRSIFRFTAFTLLLTVLLFYLCDRYGISEYSVQLFFIISLATVNLNSFLVYGIDKYLAEKNKNRIPESTLVATVYLCGTFGAYFGRSFFKHKTQKTTFIRKFRTALVLQGLIIAFIIWLVTK